MFMGKRYSFWQNRKSNTNSCLNLYAGEPHRKVRRVREILYPSETWGFLPTFEYERGIWSSLPFLTTWNVFFYCFFCLPWPRIVAARFVTGKSKVKLATIVEGDPKAPFSIATTPMCREGRYSFPGLLYFTLDPYLIMLSVNQGGIKYHFLSLWYDSTWDWTQVSRSIWYYLTHGCEFKAFPRVFDRKWT